MSDVQTLLSMTGIDKGFPGVQALQAVDFALRVGEIHAIVGENGAGKSTLIKVMTGVERPDAGTIDLAGETVQVRSPHHAQALGISTVYQEVNLCPNLSVAENVLIGRAPRRLGFIDTRAIHRRAREALRALDVDIDVSQPLGTYSVAIQQMVAIARALEASSTRILILDEPTSSLDTHETAELFGVMRKLRASGIAIVFITHFIDQIYAVADRITVLRNGRLVGTYEAASMPRYDLIARMLGRELTELEDMARMRASEDAVEGGEIRLQATGLGRAGSVEPFDLELRAGEVVGVAGLLGSGRTELAELLFGIERPDAGALVIDGSPVRRNSPRRSIERAVALCPEDRKAEGIVADLTVRENIVLALQAGRGWIRALGRAEQDALADEYIGRLGIATPDADQLVGNLSGGNQQKVILARWLATSPQILILDEPTRGIDIGAKAEVQRLVREQAGAGMSCVFISSELDEVLRTSDRVAVMRDRVKVAELEGDVDESTVIHAMAGAEPTAGGGDDARA
jgi:galactofuranose transport system ATP-binding protein